MQQQIKDEGYESFQEAFIAKNGQEAWDERLKNQEDLKEQRKMNSIIVASIGFCAFVALQNYLNAQEVALAADHLPL